MTAYIQTVLSRPIPGTEEEFNRWYDSTHMPEVLSLPGFVAGQRYAPAAPSDPYWFGPSIHRASAPGRTPTGSRGVLVTSTP
jgi:hypothetical protein